LASIKKKGGLGRGLSALLESEETDITGVEPQALNTIAGIPISQIEANPFQPRTDFDKEALEELSASIKVHGVVQPITVRKSGFEKYEIISGERRTRASILAGLTTIPAYVRLANDVEMLEMALIENIQRENLNAIEIADSYRRLLEECNLKQEELGERVGKSRSSVTNYLRLLKLPEEIQIGLRDGKLSMGHARALISVGDELRQLELYHLILVEDLNVREVERLTKEDFNSPLTKESVPKEKPETEDTRFIEFEEAKNALGHKFGATVEIKSKGKGGNLVINFSNKKHLMEILDSLS